MEMWPHSSKSGGRQYAENKEEEYRLLGELGYIGRSGWFMPVAETRKALEATNTSMEEW